MLRFGSRRMHLRHYAAALGEAFGGLPGIIASTKITVRGAFLTMQSATGHLEIIDQGSAPVPALFVYQGAGSGPARGQFNR